MYIRTNFIDQTGAFSITGQMLTASWGEPEHVYIMKV